VNLFGAIFANTARAMALRVQVVDCGLRCGFVMAAKVLGDVMVRYFVECEEVLRDYLCLVFQILCSESGLCGKA
jgi:hypothetical protein